MFKQLRKNESGVILVTILIISLVMAILAVGILSLNTSQVMSGEDLRRSIVAEYYGKMILWSIYANRLRNPSATIATFASTVIDNTTYNAYISEPTPTNFVIVVNYLP